MVKEVPFNMIILRKKICPNCSTSIQLELIAVEIEAK